MARRVATRGVMVALMLMASLVGWGQQLQFLIGDQKEPTTSYAVPASAIPSNPSLFIHIKSPFDAIALEFVVTVSESTAAPQIRLAFDQYIVAPGQGILALSSRHVLQLLRDERRLVLSLGERPMKAGTRVTITARRPHSSQVAGRLTVTVFDDSKRRVEPTTKPPVNELPPPHYLPIRLAPNPLVYGPLRIDLSSYQPTQVAQVEVVNMIGQSVLQTTIPAGSVQQIPTQSIPNGIYFVNVHVDGRSIHTDRLVIDR